MGTRNIPLSPDAQRVQRMLDRVENNGSNAFGFSHALVSNLLQELIAQDVVSQPSPLEERVKADPGEFGAQGDDPFSWHRTYIRSLGRMGGGAMTAMAVMGEDVLVFAEDEEAYKRLTPPPTQDKGLWDETLKATVVLEIHEFKEQLATGKFATAIVYGTDCFQGYLYVPYNLSELRRLASVNLVGDYPRLYVLD